MVDSFSKFTWLYPTKSTGAAEIIDKLRKQVVIFGNSQRIIFDRGTAFTSQEFESYCEKERIQHVLTTTGVPRANAQAGRVNRTLIPLLTKLSSARPEKWHKHVSTAQQYLNTTMHRSPGTTPFHLLFGIHARLREDNNIWELIERELILSFHEDRDESRLQVREHIARIQKENRKTYNKKRKKPRKYDEGDLVAIRRTQLGVRSKFAAKYLGPYTVTRALRNER